MAAERLCEAAQQPRLVGAGRRRVDAGELEGRGIGVDAETIVTVISDLAASRRARCTASSCSAGVAAADRLAPVDGPSSVDLE